MDNVDPFTWLLASSVTVKPEKTVSTPSEAEAMAACVLHFTAKNSARQICFLRRSTTQPINQFAARVVAAAVDYL